MATGHDEALNELIIIYHHGNFIIVKQLLLHSHIIARLFINNSNNLYLTLTKYTMPYGDRLQT